MNTLTSSVPNNRDRQVFGLGISSSIRSTSLSNEVGGVAESHIFPLSPLSRSCSARTLASCTLFQVLGLSIACLLSLCLCVVFSPGYESLIQPAPHIRAPIKAATAAVILNSGVEWGHHPIGIAALQGHVTAGVATFKRGSGHGIVSSIIGWSVWFARWESNPLQPTYKVGTVTGPSLANKLYSSYTHEVSKEYTLVDGNLLEIPHGKLASQSGLKTRKAQVESPALSLLSVIGNRPLPHLVEHHVRGGVVGTVVAVVLSVFIGHGYGHASGGCTTLAQLNSSAHSESSVVSDGAARSQYIGAGSTIPLTEHRDSSTGYRYVSRARIAHA